MNPASSLSEDNVIVLFHPRSTKPKNRRFPLSILALAAMLEGREKYIIVDGNVDAHPGATLDRIMRDSPAELLAVSVMPGPQMVAALPICREFRKKYPAVPIVWGGYFPTLYTDAALNAPYVDFVVRGQGEDALLELLQALRGDRLLSDVAGLSYKESSGAAVHNADRKLRAPDDRPELPYHAIDATRYVLPTFLGSRTAVHETSIGCPYSCNFCAVVPAFGSRQKMESPGRTRDVLRQLQKEYGVNAIQFYDNNFFLQEDHAREQAECFRPLSFRWWCEGRVDIVLNYSSDTLQRLKRAGATMIFFGADSGSDWVLRQMKKQMKAEQTLELAKRLRSFGIIPEFSFVVGNPHDPERDTRETIAFIRKIKDLNPDAEIIVQHYIPVPQRDNMYGDVDERVEFPTSPEEWATERWLRYATRTEPNVPWLPGRTKRRIDDFELVVSSRWPTIQDIRMPRWGRVLLKSLSSWRYACRVYGWAFELNWAQQFVNLRKPRLESL